MAWSSAGEYGELGSSRSVVSTGSGVKSVPNRTCDVGTNSFNASRFCLQVPCATS